VINRSLTFNATLTIFKAVVECCFSVNGLKDHLSRKSVAVQTFFTRSTSTHPSQSFVPINHSLLGHVKEKTTNVDPRSTHDGGRVLWATNSQVGSSRFDEMSLTNCIHLHSVNRVVPQLIYAKCPNNPAPYFAVSLRESFLFLIGTFSVSAFFGKINLSKRSSRSKAFNDGFNESTGLVFDA